MTLDRTTPPSVHDIEDVKLTQAQTHYLKNEIPVYVINAGLQPVVSIEIIFKAGGWYENKRGISWCMTQMITQGTRHHTAAQIAEAFSFHGAFVQKGNSGERMRLSLYLPLRHLKSLMPLVKEILTEATFPADELDTFIRREIQNLKVNQLKTSYRASSRFKQLIFGENHPYGSILDENDLKSITREDLQTFYNRLITSFNCEVVVAGPFGNEDLKIIDETLGADNWGSLMPAEPPLEVLSSIRKRTEIIVMEDSVQSSIRVGRLLFARTHPDYFKMRVANCLLGGYFGSRLMKNLREEKGLTYGIHSQLLTYEHAGAFVIGTDVNKENTEQALEEIYKEINKLRTTIVSPEEMETVRNYMLGSFLGSVATPFDLAEKFKVIHFGGLSYSHYTMMLESIRLTAAEDITRMAELYLIPALITQVVAGGQA